MAERRRAPRRPTPYEDGRSWSGVVVWWIGAGLGAVSSLSALIFGLYALAYAEHSVWLGGYSYGCDGGACATEHVGAALLCLGSVVVYVVLLVVAPFTSARMLRIGVRLGLGWAAITVVASVIGSWEWLVLLAISPALMSTGSWMRLRTRQRLRARMGS